MKTKTVIKTTLSLLCLISAALMFFLGAGRAKAAVMVPDGSYSTIEDSFVSYVQSEELAEISFADAKSAVKGEDNTAYQYMSAGSYYLFGTDNVSSLDGNSKLVYMPAVAEVVIPAYSCFDVNIGLEYSLTRYVSDPSADTVASAAFYYFGHRDMSSEVAFRPFLEDVSEYYIGGALISGVKDNTGFTHDGVIAHTEMLNNNTSEPVSFFLHFGIMAAVQYDADYDNTMELKATLSKTAELHSVTGAGTEEDPYLVYTADNLLDAMAKKDNEVNYITLASDITTDAELTLGGVYTGIPNPMVLDLGGKTLTLTGDSALTLMQDATVKNGNIVQTGSSSGIYICPDGFDDTECSNRTFIFEDLTVESENVAVYMMGISEMLTAEAVIRNCSFTGGRSEIDAALSLGPNSYASVFGVALNSAYAYRVSGGSELTLDGLLIQGEADAEFSEYHTHSDEDCDCICDRGGETWHTPKEDDGDCTTALMCLYCSAEISTAGEHSYTDGCDADCNNEGCLVTRAPSHESDTYEYISDGEGHHDTVYSCCGAVYLEDLSCTSVKEADLCTDNEYCICGYITKAAADHTPSSDDGDCTTAVICTVCSGTVAEATEHSYTDRCDTDCNNEGCLVTRTAPHEGVPDKYIGNGEGRHDIFYSCCDTVYDTDVACASEREAESCTDTEYCLCGYITRAAGSHIPSEDDGDCTTDVLCTVCENAVVKGRESHEWGEWSDWIDGGDGTESKSAVCTCGTDAVIKRKKQSSVSCDNLHTEAEVTGGHIFMETEENEIFIPESEKSDIKVLTGTKKLLYFGITLTDMLTESKIENTSRVLEIAVRFDMSGKKNIGVLRNHKGVVSAFAALEERPETGYTDGSYYIDFEEEIIYIYTDSFSVYALSYDLAGNAIPLLPPEDTGAGGDFTFGIVAAVIVVLGILGLAVLKK